MNSESYKPKLLLTSGEPAGIGPEMLIKLAQINHSYDITVIADSRLLHERAESISLSINLLDIESNSSLGNNASNQNQLKIIDLKLKDKSVAGQLNTANGPYILEMLDMASSLCLEGKFDAMVTNPIQKSVINDAGFQFSGHTEYLASKCNTDLPVMLLACPELKVALVTTHLPLLDVPKLITKERLENVLQIVQQDLVNRFGIGQPKIIVCGLNPHAGESGHLGNEESLIIEPVINKLNHEGFKITGPLPADTAFTTDNRKDSDVFVCMYHDQGLPVLKTLGFGEAVNITLGLPIIRTSVDHGTALDLAGTGKANINSLLAAIEMAEHLVLKSKHNSKLKTNNTLANV